MTARALYAAGKPPPTALTKAADRADFDFAVRGYPGGKLSLLALM